MPDGSENLNCPEKPLVPDGSYKYSDTLGSLILKVIRILPKKILMDTFYGSLKFTLRDAIETNNFGIVTRKL